MAKRNLLGVLLSFFLCQCANETSAPKFLNAKQVAQYPDLGRVVQLVPMGYAMGFVTEAGSYGMVDLLRMQVYQQSQTYEGESVPVLQMSASQEQVYLLAKAEGRLLIFRTEGQVFTKWAEMPLPEGMKSVGLQASEKGCYLAYETENQLNMRFFANDDKSCTQMVSTSLPASNNLKTEPFSRLSMAILSQEKCLSLPLGQPSIYLWDGTSCDYKGEPASLRTVALPTFTPKALSIAPSEGILLAGHTQPRDNTPQSGLWESTNEGADWQKLSLQAPDARSVQYLFESKGLLVAGKDGIFYTPDKGKSWQQLSTEPTDMVGYDTSGYIFAVQSTELRIFRINVKPTL